MIEEKPSLDTPGPALVVQSLPAQYGRYVLLERLGAGGMAEVFRAVVTGLEQFQSAVVVKRILPHLSENAAFVSMFIDEAKLCGRLQHPNIIRVHDFGKQDDRFFIAMEYVQGRTIGAIMSRLGERREPMPPSVAAEIIRQASLGLAHAHALRGNDGKPLGIIHRDVSPGNVMVDYAGAVKVLDFGVARVANSFRRSTTDPGHVKGKSAYLAPEQLGGSFDHRADIFAIGILLHEMLSGRRLFKAPSAFENMKLVRSMVIPPPSASNPAVPAALDAIVLRALTRDPNARYQSAGELAEALAQYLLDARAVSQELLQFMTTRFEDDRRAQEQVFAREALERRHVTPPPLPRTAEVSVGEGLPAPDARPGTGSMSAPGGLVAAWPEPVVEEELETPPRARVSRRTLALGGAAISLAAVLGVVFTRRKPTAAVRAPTRPSGALVTAAAPPGPAAAAPVTTPTPEPATAPEPASVEISVSSDPEGALVQRPGDHTPLGVTPLVFSTPRTDSEMVFRISKAGYVEGLLKMVPNANKSTLVTLARRTLGNNSSARPVKNRRKVIDAVPSDPFAE
jgi:serine/threonine-protein kinase